ncbi:scamp family-domain-containing protein [Ephemerocybe angulata]|uniref:Scamp family-domain-containing protein n=1 Tax=Ephemerocybe angulata TaxID=980116 RepID=A0A8H6IIU8_9AGAR|nr:scamp family-domain-containing protein [Tulosesus angulatus]
MSYTQNPFASSHSLDTNPFDDPPQQSSGYAAAEQARLEEIRRREQDLERRESELNTKADNLRRNGRNNFPPFFPLVFHSIKDEIPEASRPLITRLYQLWLVLLATLIVNVVACVFILTAGAAGGGSDLGSSIGYGHDCNSEVRGRLIFFISYLVFIPITSFLLWYRPIYNGYMKEQALYYYLYFFFGGFHLVFSLYMIIGIPGTGACGLIRMIDMYSKHLWVAAVLGTVSTVGWFVQGFGNTFYYLQIYRHHTAAGHTIEKAKAELTTHGAKAYFSRG